MFDLAWKGETAATINGEEVSFAALIEVFFNFINFIFNKYFPENLA